MNEKRKKGRPGLAVVLVGLAAVCAAVCLLLTRPPEQPENPTAGTALRQTEPVETVRAPVRVEAAEKVSIALENGLRITDVGKYTGVYMEDGSDEIVSGILMIAVTNEGEDTIQYAEITMPVGEQTASFSLSTLPPGRTVILLERSRMDYVPGEYTTAAASRVALFSEPLSLCSDRLQIQTLNGAINVKNISGEDIEGDIVIYYKNSASDVFYGGITYRVRLEGGLAAGEIRQIIASHFSASGSTILFVTCGDS